MHGRTLGDDSEPVIESSLILFTDSRSFLILAQRGTKTLLWDQTCFQGLGQLGLRKGGWAQELHVQE